MKKLKLVIASLSIAFGSSAIANNSFYEDLGESTGHEFNYKDEVSYEVLFFFNYNCSACYSFEKNISIWEDNLPPKTALKSIPFSAKKGWEWADRFHFYSNKIDRNLSRKSIFESEVVQRSTITSEQDLLAALASIHNISNDKAKAFYQEIAIGKFENIAKGLATKYNVYGTPSLVLNVKGGQVYRVQPNGQLTYEQMVQVVNGLIAFHENKLTN
ncbi:hypothetical protein [Vibrio crassostreae]|uniref:hypothetical protein n=1 Tax=Vibrio crassostreae TaxID=246167 RepID=UPI001B304549|nr:hypothetical protein [Vibrio crassostreae]